MSVGQSLVAALPSQPRAGQPLHLHTQATFSEVWFKMSKNLSLVTPQGGNLSLLTDPEPPESGQSNAGCRQEEVKELLQLLAVPGTDLQPELLFCGSSFHGNVAPCLGSEGNAGGPQQNKALAPSFPYLGKRIGQSLETPPENGVS